MKKIILIFTALFVLFPLLIFGQGRIGCDFTYPFLTILENLTVNGDINADGNIIMSSGSYIGLQPRLYFHSDYARWLGTGGTDARWVITDDGHNKISSTWAQASDTSAVMAYVDGDGYAILSLIGQTGRESEIKMTTDLFWNQKAGGFWFQQNGTYIIKLEAGVVRLHQSSATSIGNSTYPFENMYGKFFNCDSLNIDGEKSNLADDAQITFATGVCGWGEAMIGDNQEWATFRFTSAGVVTLISNSTNVANTDSDGNLCIYDAGSGIAIKNRLGSTLKTAIWIKYYTP